MPTAFGSDYASLRTYRGTKLHQGRRLTPIWPVCTHGMVRRSGIWLALVLRGFVVYSEPLSIYRHCKVDGRWMIMNVEHWWNHNWQGKSKYLKKSRPSATSATPRPTWTILASKTGYPRENPENSSLSYDTAIKTVSVLNHNIQTYGRAEV